MVSYMYGWLYMYVILPKVTSIVLNNNETIISFGMKQQWNNYFRWHERTMKQLSPLAWNNNETIIPVGIKQQWNNYLRWHETTMKQLSPLAWNNNETIISVGMKQQWNNYLCWHETTMKQLSPLGILHAHKILIDSLDLIDIANSFIFKSDSRRLVFGRF